MPTRTLQKLPSSASLYPKALINSFKKKPAGGLPDLALNLSAVGIDRQHLADYNTVCGFTQSDTLSPTYLHMLVMPLQMALMTEDSFPFPLLGLVHIRNTITQHRPVDASEKVNVTCRFGELKPHDKGQQFTFIGEVFVGNELVWTGESTYLFRQANTGGGGQGGGKSGEDKPADASAQPFNALWSVPADIGRRYAKVSGDSNPIHLYAFTAKLFGFPRAIAHGMWTKAHCLAALESRLPRAFTVDVQFKLPVLLPAKVAFQSVPGNNGAAGFSVFDAKSGKPHLAGQITLV